MLGAVPAAAQPGQVRGAVLDETGAVLPGATVTLRGPDGARATSTGGAGEYLFENVSDGVYAVTVSLSGFSDATVEDVVVAGAPVEAPAVTLSLASFGDTVVVTASRTEVRVVDAPSPRRSSRRPPWRRRRRPTSARRYARCPASTWSSFRRATST